MSVAAVILLKIVQLLISALLIGIVAIQTTKNEGLSGGSIGGQVTPTFKGKPGVDEQMRNVTIKLSVAWFVISILVAIVSSRS